MSEPKTTDPAQTDVDAAWRRYREAEAALAAAKLERTRALHALIDARNAAKREAANGR